MKTLSALLALVVAVPCSAASALAPAERVAAIAASAGLALPGACAFEAPRFAPVKSADLRRAAQSPVNSGSAYGTGWVNGSGWLHCSGANNQPGWFSGWIRLDGDIRVNGPDGTTGNIRVDGSVHVSGSCRDGAGFAGGSGRVSGSGYLYKDGRPVGRADVSGTVFLNRYVHGHAWFNEHVSVNGYFRAD